MRVYGLTGNIASGKSTVARLFRALGAPVVDADLVARQIVLPGTPALADIAQRFPGVLAADGTLSRKLLAARVFQDPAELSALNAITHPRIGEEVAAQLGAFAIAGQPFALYEAALIVENNLHQAEDGLIVVTAPVEEQVRRLAARDQLGPAEARARLDAQLPVARKVALADFVIDNSGAEQELQAQVQRVFEQLQSGFRRGKK